VTRHCLTLVTVPLATAGGTGRPSRRVSTSRCCASTAKNPILGRRSDRRKRRFGRARTANWCRRARISSRRSRRVDSANRIAARVRMSCCITPSTAIDYTNVNKVCPDAILAMHSAPQIRGRHVANQRAHVRWHRWAPGAVSAFPRERRTVAQTCGVRTWCGERARWHTC